MSTSPSRGHPRAAWRSPPPRSRTHCFRAGQSLTTILKRPIIADSLPLNNLTFAGDRSAITFSPDSVRFRCTLSDYRCAPAPAAGGQGPGRDFCGGLYGVLPNDNVPPRVSPDSQWDASVRNFNIHVKRVGAKDGFFLSTDGSEGNAYAMRSIAWSPHSKRIAAYRVRPGFRREVYYVESSPEDQVQPKHSSRLYNKPGDVLDVELPVFSSSRASDRLPSTTRSSECV